MPIDDKQVKQMQTFAPARQQPTATVAAQPSLASSAQLQRTYGNRKLGQKRGDGAGAPSVVSGIEAIVQRGESFAARAPLVQRKMEKIDDIKFFQPLTFYNNDAMKAENRKLQSYFDAFVRRTEPYTFDDFIKAAESKPFEPEKARIEIREAKSRNAKKEKQEDTPLVATTTAPKLTLPPPKFEEQPKKPSLELALTMLDPKDYDNRSAFISALTDMTGLPQKTVYDQAREAYDNASSKTTTSSGPAREKRIAEMLEKSKKDDKASTTKSPAETIGYTVEIPSDIRKGAKKEGFESELDDWATEIATTGASTRGAYSVASTVLQHYWIGSTATQAVFFHVNHGASRVEIKALGKHVGDNNKYSSYANVEGYSFRNL